MLQQILKDMYIDPDVLEALNEDQKKTLFLKMRQEQVRRWTEREEGEGGVSQPLNARPTTANSKRVSWLLGRDGDVAVMVIGELDELKSSKIICSGLGGRKSPSLHSNTDLQTTLKSSLVNKTNTPPSRAGRENLPPRKHTGVQLNLKGSEEVKSTEEVKSLPPLQVSASEHPACPAVEEQLERKKAAEPESAPPKDREAEERPSFARYRPHIRVVPAALRLISSLPCPNPAPAPGPPPSPTPTPTPAPSQTPAPALSSSPAQALARSLAPPPSSPVRAPTAALPPTSTPAQALTRRDSTPAPSSYTVPTPAPAPSLVPTPAPAPSLVPTPAPAPSLVRTPAPSLVRTPAPSLVPTPAPAPSLVRTPAPSLVPTPAPYLAPSPPSLAPALSPVPAPTPSLAPVPSPVPVPALAPAPSPAPTTHSSAPATSGTASKTHADPGLTAALAPPCLTTRLHPQQPQEPLPLESQGSRDAHVTTASHRAVSVEAGPEGGGAGRGRVAQLMKTFSAQSASPPAQAPPPRGNKPPIPTKPSHLRLMTTPSLR